MAANIEPTVREKLHQLWGDGNGGVPSEVQDIINNAFKGIPATSFPQPHLGKVVEISSDATILEAIQTLSENNILSAPVRNVSVPADKTWSERYLGMVDFPAIVLWVLEQAELAAAALAAGTAAATGMGAGAAGALGAVALGMTGPVAVAGLTAAAVGAAIAGGVAVDRGMGKDPQSAANALGEDFYRILLQEEPFKSTKVSDVTKSYRWAPFLPVQPNDNMLTVLLLLSKFRLRSVPVVEMGSPYILNLITQSAVVRGLAQCKGYDWFDLITTKTLLQLGLPLMAPDEVVTVDEKKLVLEAFVLMREKGIGGLPVTQGEERKIVANMSVRDARFLLLQPELFHKRKDLTVETYVSIVSNYAAEPSEFSPVLQPPVTCQVTDTLLDVITTLATRHIHRIYVVDDNMCVQGIITLRDIISRFVTEPKGYFDNYLGGMIDEAVFNDAK
eukprot:jgi/Mesen1/2643/ME000166S01768